MQNWCIDASDSTPLLAWMSEAVSAIPKNKRSILYGYAYAKRGTNEAKSQNIRVGEKDRGSEHKATGQEDSGAGLAALAEIMSEMEKDVNSAKSDSECV